MTRRRALAAGTLVLGFLAIATTAGIYAGRSGLRFESGLTGGRAPGGGPGGTGLPVWAIENAITALSVVAAVSLAVLLLVVAWLYGRDGLSTVARLFVENILAAVFVLLFFAGVRLLMLYALPASSGSSGAGSGEQTGGEGAGGAGGAEGAEGAIPPIVMVLVALAVLLLVLYVAMQRGQAETESRAGGTSVPRPDAAGSEPDEQAIDIEDVPQTNAVYRAWRDMATRAVDVSERTVTASEVARAAIRSGFDRQAVGRLTALFEEVRYGDRPVTEERERHAEAALRALDDAEEGSA